jgi:hypothetical protein
VSDEVLAQARRLHMHVMNGGNVTAIDMSRLVQGMERLQAERVHIIDLAHLAIEYARKQAYADARGHIEFAAECAPFVERFKKAARAALGELNSISDNPPPCPNPEQACRQYQATPGVWVCSNFGCARMPKQLKEQTHE